MIDRKPPRIAVWLLRHLASPYQRESLVGDLFEMYCAGRSGAWYWRQVIAALSFAGLRALRLALRTSFGSALLRLVNALLLAGVIALGIGTFTQADTTRTEAVQSDSR